MDKALLGIKNIFVSDKFKVSWSIDKPGYSVYADVKKEDKTFATICVHNFDVPEVDIQITGRITLNYYYSCSSLEEALAYLKKVCDDLNRLATAINKAKYIRHKLLLVTWYRITNPKGLRVLSGGHLRIFEEIAKKTEDYLF